MKRFDVIILASILSVTTFAQQRFHVQNVTDYEAVLKSSQNNTTMRNVSSRTSAPLPCVGSPNIPIILVQFADKAFVSDTLNDNTIQHSDANVNAFYQKYCNGSGIEGQNYRFHNGSYGAVYDYFVEQSDSIFKPHFDVIGPVTLSKSYKYYGEDTNSTSADTRPRIQEFFSESVTLAIAAGTDFDNYDNDNNGTIDFVFFIFAGEGQNSYGTIDYLDECGIDEEYSYLIWPKESSASQKIGDYTFGGYGLTNETFVLSGTTYTDGIGTMCHELSHGLGLPDFYDVNYVNFGMDYWDLMDSGSYCFMGRCPAGYTGYEREFMGWRSIKEVSLTEGQTLTLQPMEKGGEPIKLVNPNNSDEYYIIENRQPIGFDLYFGWVYSSVRSKYGPNKGLLITHVDYKYSEWVGNRVNTSSTHQRMTILPADSKLITSMDGYTTEYYESIAGDLYPGSQNTTYISHVRFKCFTGDPLETNVTNIVQNDDGSVMLELNYGSTDCIDDIIYTDKNKEDNIYFDLSGRKVICPSKGVYIVNGKKVFIK